MRDAASVISQAVDGIGGKLADEYEITPGRMSEMLGSQCVYPKTKILIRRIAAVDESPDKGRVRLVKADLDALFAELLSGADESACVTELHKEGFEAVDAILSGKSGAEQLAELRDLRVVVDQMIAGREKLLSTDNVRQWAKDTVNRNGGKKPA